MENSNFESPKNNRNKLIAVIAAIVIFISGYGTALFSQKTNYGDVPNSTVKNLNRINKLIENNYYTDYDKNALFKNLEEFMVYGLNDPYSYYLDEKAVEEYNEDITGNYVGIGVTLTPGESGEIKILAPFEGSPAMEAGILPEDILYKINGKEYMYDNVDEAVTIMRGKSGEKVTLELKRQNSDNITVDVEKRKIEIASVTSEKLSDNLLLFRISRFDITTSDDFVAELEKYEINKDTGIILDLRDNPGGVVVSALEIADCFISDGILITEKYKNREDVVTDAGEKKIECKYPIAILANKYSASASEIVTGAIKDHKAGILIGETTYGKGLLNQKFTIDDHSSLVLSIGEYTTPSGESIHKKGIKPDYEVQLPDNLKTKLSSNLTYDEDIQLKKAIELLSKGAAQ